MAPTQRSEDQMDILSAETGSKGRYYTIVEGHEAEVTYSRASPQLVIVDHTGVPDALRGKGVGQALAAYAVEAARKGSWKIMPLCPFFRAQALRHQDWHDVVTF
jgi:predicted GNAT family acetyltransferase